MKVHFGSDYQSFIVPNRQTWCLLLKFGSHRLLEINYDWHWIVETFEEIKFSHFVVLLKSFLNPKQAEKLKTCEMQEG